MLLTEEEVTHYLGVDRAEVKKLIQRGKLTAFKVGGTYLRFRKEEVAALKAGKRFVPPEELSRSWPDKIKDFWKFNSFYVLSGILVLLLIVFIFEHQ